MRIKKTPKRHFTKKAVWRGRGEVNEDLLRPIADHLGTLSEWKAAMQKDPLFIKTQTLEQDDRFLVDFIIPRHPTGISKKSREKYWQSLSEMLSDLRNNQPSSTNNVTGEDIAVLLAEATRNVWKGTPDKMQEKMADVIVWYAWFAVTRRITFSNLYRYVVNHLRFIRNAKPTHRKPFKPKAGTEELKMLYAKEFAKLEEVARIFVVELRQVQRWVKSGQLVKQEGKIPRSQYLQYAKQRKPKYDHVVRSFNELFPEFSNLKTLHSRKGKQKQTKTKSTRSASARITKPKQKQPTRRKGK